MNSSVVTCREIVLMKHNDKVAYHDMQGLFWPKVPIFSPSSNKNMTISSQFFLANIGKNLMASLKWREGPEIFQYLTQNCTKKAENGAK